MVGVSVSIYGILETSEQVDKEEYVTRREGGPV